MPVNISMFLSEFCINITICILVTIFFLSSCSQVCIFSVLRFQEKALVFPSNRDGGSHAFPTDVFNELGHELKINGPLQSLHSQ